MSTDENLKLAEMNGSLQQSIESFSKRKKGMVNLRKTVLNQREHIKSRQDQLEIYENKIIEAQNKQKKEKQEHLMRFDQKINNLQVEMLKTEEQLKELKEKKRYLRKKWKTTEIEKSKLAESISLSIEEVHSINSMVSDLESSLTPDSSSLINKLVVEASRMSMKRDRIDFAIEHSRSVLRDLEVYLKQLLTKSQQLNKRVRMLKEKRIKLHDSFKKANRYLISVQSSTQGEVGVDVYDKMVKEAKSNVKTLKKKEIRISGDLDASERQIEVMEKELKGKQTSISLHMSEKLEIERKMKFISAKNEKNGEKQTEIEESLYEKQLEIVQCRRDLQKANLEHLECKRNSDYLDKKESLLKEYADTLNKTDSSEIDEILLSLMEINILNQQFSKCGEVKRPQLATGEYDETVIARKIAVIEKRRNQISILKKQYAELVASLMVQQPESILVLESMIDTFTTELSQWQSNADAHYLLSNYNAKIQDMLLEIQKK